MLVHQERCHFQGHFFEYQMDYFFIGDYNSKPT